MFQWCFLGEKLRLQKWKVYFPEFVQCENMNKVEKTHSESLCERNKQSELQRVLKRRRFEEQTSQRIKENSANKQLNIFIEYHTSQFTCSQISWMVYAVMSPWQHSATGNEPVYTWTWEPCWFVEEWNQENLQHVINVQQPNPDFWGHPQVEGRGRCCGSVALSIQWEGVSCWSVF